MAKGLSPRIRVAAPTGATITGTLGGDTVSFVEKSTGVYEADVEKLGPWSLTMSKGGISETGSISVDDVGLFEGELNFPAFADYTWAEISAIGAAGNGANLFSIGDTRPVALNGTVGIATYTNASYNVFIAHFNYKGQNGIYLMGFMDPTTSKVLGLRDTRYNGDKSDGTKTYNMNHWGDSSSPYNTNYGGWKGCDLRYDILGSTNVAPSGYGSTPTTSRAGNDPSNYDIVNSPVSNTLMAALPSALRENMKPFTVYTDNKGNSSTVANKVTASVDYIVLPAEYEVSGTKNIIANENEAAQQEQLEFYRLGNSKITYDDTAPINRVGRLERSPYRSNAFDFAIVIEDGSKYHGYSRRSYALTPLLRVA